MKELFTIIKERLLEGKPMVLLTIIHSEGSSPRGAGARMLVCKEQGKDAERLWGTIGGGLHEYLAMEEAGGLLLHPSGKKILSKEYILNSEGEADLGLRCGGRLNVAFRVLDAAEEGLLGVMEKAISCFPGMEPSKNRSADNGSGGTIPGPNDGRALWFIMEVSEGKAEDPFLGIAGEDGFIAQTGPFSANLDPLFKRGPVCLEAGGKLYFSEPLISSSVVCVFGGGHIAQELVPLLVHLDFRCLVFDDREAFTDPALFPGAERIIMGDFQTLEKYITLGENDYAVIVTRGHLHDMEAWAFALESPAAYIGVIGSKSKHDYVKTCLRQRGFGDEMINAKRVHAPIGVDIKSKTPAEIAVSIAAELIQVRTVLRERP